MVLELFWNNRENWQQFSSGHIESMKFHIFTKGTFKEVNQSIGPRLENSLSLSVPSFQHHSAIEAAV